MKSQTYREAVLKVAQSELKQGAREIGGNNRGPFVDKYLAPSGVRAPQPWCAAFVSWCLLRAAQDQQVRPPLPYLIRVRSVWSEANRRGWVTEDPQPGDLVVWWRGSKTGPLGHIGIVEARAGSLLGTIEGNRTSRVAQFSYRLGRMPRLLGFVRIDID